MSPPFYRDWWLAAALTSTALPVGIAQAADIPTPVGVVTALSPSGTPADGGNTLHVGSDITPGMRLHTQSDSPLHVLFLDQSALTLGPDSELTIDEFRYDADTRQGQIRLGLNKGSLRIVGGHISKNNAAVITTPDATVEVLGGITLVSVSGGATQSTFLFGQQMRGKQWQWLTNRHPARLFGQQQPQWPVCAHPDGAPAADQPADPAGADPGPAQPVATAAHAAATAGQPQRPARQPQPARATAGTRPRAHQYRQHAAGQPDSGTEHAAQQQLQYHSILIASGQTPR